MKNVMMIAVLLALCSTGCRYHYDGNCPNNNCVEEATVEDVLKEVAEGEEFVTLFVKPITSELIKITDKSKVIKLLDEKYNKRFYVVYASTIQGSRLAKQAELTKFPSLVIVKKVNGNLTLSRKLEGFTTVEEAEKFLGE